MGKILQGKSDVAKDLSGSGLGGIQWPTIALMNSGMPSLPNSVDDPSSVIVIVPLGSLYH